jgi:hypothetical protein
MRAIERVLALSDGMSPIGREGALRALSAVQDAVSTGDTRQWQPVGGVSSHVLDAVRGILLEWPSAELDRERASAALADAAGGMSLQQWRQRHLPRSVVELPQVELPQPSAMDAAAQADDDRARRIAG